MNVQHGQQLLAQVRHYAFEATSNEATGWQGTGRGTVRVEQPAPDVLLFHENGVFESRQKSFNSRNVYRWTFRPVEQLVSLEHLRFGAQHPIYLFDLAPDQPNLWHSVCPHLCSQDEYHAQLAFEQPLIDLEWHILGPETFTRIRYQYTLQR